MTIGRLLYDGTQLDSVQFDVPFDQANFVIERDLTEDERMLFRVDPRAIFRWFDPKQAMLLIETPPEEEE